LNREDYPELANALGVTTTTFTVPDASVKYQANWNETDTNQGGFIKNKPNIVASGANVSVNTNMIASGFMQASQPHCDVHSPNNATSGNIYIFSTVVRNNGNHYNASTGQFTCPLAGVYFVSFIIRRNNIASGQYSHAFVSIDNTNIPRLSALSSTVATPWVTISASGAIFAAANATIAIRDSDSGGAVETTQCGMTVYFLG
jgi:hypothetical protein